MWEETMDSPFPSNRTAGSVLESFYPVDDYVVLIRDGKPVAGIGYAKRDGFYIRGGGYSVEKGAYREVYQEADNVIPLPYIAGFSSSTVSPEEWAKMAQRKGWDTNPTDEQLGQYANNPTVKAFKEYYGENHPTGAAWGVKGLLLSKMWWNIIFLKNKIRCAPITNSIYKKTLPYARRQFNIHRVDNERKALIQGYFRKTGLSYLKSSSL